MYFDKASEPFTQGPRLMRNLGSWMASTNVMLGTWSESFRLPPDADAVSGPIYRRALSLQKIY